MKLTATVHEKPHGPKIQRNAQNLCVSPDAVVLELIRKAVTNLVLICNSQRVSRAKRLIN